VYQVLVGIDGQVARGHDHSGPAPDVVTWRGRAFVYDAGDGRYHEASVLRLPPNGGVRRQLSSGQEVDDGDE
jgi:hypothetical protein